jgi:hypothetical protein
MISNWETPFFWETGRVSHAMTVWDSITYLVIGSSSLLVIDGFMLLRLNLYQLDLTG